jgi:hypothetical protein
MRQPMRQPKIQNGFLNNVFDIWRFFNICLGFYEYYEAYVSDYYNDYVREPVHFMKAPENIYEYEYVSPISSPHR